MTSPVSNTSVHYDDEDDHSHTSDQGMEPEGEHEPEDQEWDEGGPSQCGYSESVHDTLMSVGKSVHNVVGEPSETVEDGMKSLGGWFQEASYAVRDFVRGNKEVEDDASKALATMKDDAYAAVSDIMGSKQNETETKVITAEGATAKAS